MAVEVDDSVIRNFDALKTFLNEKGYDCRQCFNERKDIIQIGREEIRKFWFFGRREQKIIVPITHHCYLYSSFLNIKCLQTDLDEVKRLFEDAYFIFTIKIEVVA